MPSKFGRPIAAEVSDKDMFEAINPKKGQVHVPTAQLRDLLTGGWRDLRAPLIGAKQGGISDPILFSFGTTGNVKQYKFGIGDEVFLAFHIDHDIKPGSTGYMHVHWATDGVNTASVKWELNYTFAERNDDTADAFGAEDQIYLEQAGSGIAWGHVVTEDPTGFTVPPVDSLLLIHLKRVTNGATDNTDGVFGLFCDIHYETDRHATPSRAPDFYTEP